MCSKIVDIEKTTNFETIRGRENWLYDTGSMQRSAGKGRVPYARMDLRVREHKCFFTCFRMWPSTFEELISLLLPVLKESVIVRDPIGPIERIIADVFCL